MPPKEIFDPGSPLSPDLSGLHLTAITAQDRAVITEQLDREPRGMAAIAHRCQCGTPMVVATLPRLEDGSPFPTCFYLTDPEMVRVVSKLEAAGQMADLNEWLTQSPDLQEKYEKAHRHYLAARAFIAQQHSMSHVHEIEKVSAGGMPTRIKCLHALVGHALAAGPGVNPIGDLVLGQLLMDGAWTEDPCPHCR